jgi:hypothetical protein
MKKFLKKHRSKEFRHSEELFTALENGNFESRSAPRLFDLGVDAEHLKAIYKIRAGIIEEKGTTHAKSILKDTRAFLEELNETKDKKVKIWRFESPEGISYTVFEGAQTENILGCIKAKDKTRVSEEEWKQLWENKALGAISSGSASRNTPA